jgi:hypothetical protein
MTNYYNVSIGDSDERLQWVVDGQWRKYAGSSSGYGFNTFGEFLEGIPTGELKLFYSDLYKSSNNINITSQIYQNYVKEDIQRLAGIYAEQKYSTTAADPLENQYKKDIVIGFFDGLHDTEIVEALKGRLKTKTTTVQAGVVGQNVSFSRLILHYNIVQQLNSYDNSNSISIGVVESIIDDLGFKEWLSEQDTLFDGLNLPDNELAGLASLNAVTAADQSKLNTLKRAARAVKGLPPPEELSAEDRRNVNQCALISDLLHKGDSYTEYPKAWKRGLDPNCESFFGRIYPVTIDGFNPNSLVNMCTMPKNIKSFFESKNLGASRIIWNLFWVFIDSTGQLKEEQIFKQNKTSVDSDLNLKLANLEANKFLEGLENNFYRKYDSIITTGNLGYTIQSVNITYDGTNPSTARNDVAVKLTISLNSMAALTATCAYAALSVDNDGDGTADESQLVEIKISDLVTGTQANSYESRVVGHAESNREFIPDSSRIRLKAKSVTALGDSDVILDLAVTGHEVSRSSSDGKATLTIDYRGYFEQSMDMPYNDALADEPLIKARQARKEKIREARKNKCSTKLIRELVRVNQEQERLEVEQFHKNGGLIKRIYDSGWLYEYSIDPTKLSVGLNGNILDPRQKYITSITSDTNTLVQTQARLNKNLSDANKEERTILGFDPKNSKALEDIYFLIEDDSVNLNSEEISKYEKERCFYLGDLMELLLDCMYEATVDNNGKVSRSATMKASAKGMNMRFVVGTINVPDPKDLNSFITINPLQIPIDMAFFASWYHDTIVKKGITHYPVGVFMKDLIERLINDVIYGTCFSLLLPDEQPPQLRMTFFSDCDDKWFGTFDSDDTLEPPTGVWFDPNVPYANGSTQNPNILMKKNFTFPIEKTKNYCVIYQQYPSYFRQLKYQQGEDTTLKDDPYCPTIYYGYNITNLNFIDNPTFKKSDTTYLKEARFFSNQLGSLSLLSNVYDLDFSFSKTNVNTFFYPGNIVNFVLTDFDGGSTTKWNSFAQVKAGIDSSNPHKKGTLANTLGMGGYHIVKSVSYEITNTENNNAKITISTKFTGTDAIGDDDPESNATPYANEQKRCITAYNSAVNAIRTTEQQTGQTTGVQRIYEPGVADADPTNTTSTEATRVSMAPVVSNSTGGNATPVTIVKTPTTPNAVQTLTNNADPLGTKYTYNQTVSWKKGKKVKGDTISTSLYGDKILTVKSVVVNKNNKTVTVVWSVPDTGDKTVTYKEVQ